MTFNQVVRGSNPRCFINKGSLSKIKLPLLNIIYLISYFTIIITHAGVAELADALDLGSSGQPCGFKSHLLHFLCVKLCCLITAKKCIITIDYINFAFKINQENDMIYNEFKGLQISDLGFNTQRLPVIDQNDFIIDEAQAEEMIDYALKHGINYFETAENYHGGTAAALLGRILSKYDRNSFFLANKFPGYDLKNMPRYESIFEKQLEDCRTDYFDFYMLHNVDELNIDSYLSNDNHVMDYLIEQKERGRIRHLGIHSNGKCTTIERFLNVFGDNIEFAQIQLNYLDWTLLGAKDRVEYLRKRGLPIWATGPLKNGQLTKIEKTYEDTLRMFRPEETTAGWAYRFVQSTAAVKTILSSISSLDQLKSDISIFEGKISLLNGKEAAILMTLVDDALSRKLINCTACHNCTEYCRHRLDIPTLIDLYNEYKFTNSTEFITRPWSTIPKDKLPSKCVGCGACEKVCPNHIKVSEIMKELSEIMASA